MQKKSVFMTLLQYNFTWVRRKSHHMRASHFRKKEIHLIWPKRVLKVRVGLYFFIAVSKEEAGRWH